MFSTSIIGRTTIEGSDRACAENDAIAARNVLNP
jgi:hypothetical protein